MPVPPVIQMYRYVMGSGGGVSNLLRGSEELGSTGVGRWNQDLMNAVNSDQVNNPEGTEQTADQLDFQASKSAKIRQNVTLVAGTEYTFSVWARAASGTQPFRLRYYDNVGGSGGASAFTASATWSPTTGRYSFTFTAANSGTFTMMIQNAADAVSRRIYFWGAMLNEGGTAADYIKTTFIGPSSPATPLMEFGDNFAGVTAYYSLRRFTIGEDTNAIRVRRSSDDTEQDIGFDSNGDLDSTALLAFVNEDVTKADTDFSTDTSGTSESGLDRLANQSIGERSGVLKGTIQATTEEHRLIITAVDTGGKSHRLQTSIYIPSGQSGQTVDGFRIENGGLEVYATTTTKDAWVDIDLTWSSSGNSNIFIKFLPSGGAESWTGNGTDEVYIGDVTITQTTADGAVTTFYDQTGNGNDATNATESEQPLVVSGGTLVEENSKAAVKFDGSDDFLSNTFPSTISQPTYWFVTHNFHATPSAFDGVIANFSTDPEHRLYLTGSLNYGLQAGGFIQYNTYQASQALVSYKIDQSDERFYFNGSEQTASSGTGIGSNALESIILGALNQTSGNTPVQFQEIILFDSDQSGNRGSVSLGTGIEGNINTYFDIV